MTICTNSKKEVGEQDEQELNELGLDGLFEECLNPAGCNGEESQAPDMEQTSME